MRDRFERDITLPTNVNADQARASFDNGLLTLTLPKAQAAHGHKIQIGQGQYQGQLQGTATGAHYHDQPRRDRECLSLLGCRSP